MKKWMLLFLVSFIIGCSTTIENKKSWTGDYFGQTEAGLPHGFGILMAAQNLYVGKFQNGKKEGWFKVIYPDGGYAFKHFRKGYIGRNPKNDIFINSEFIALGTPTSHSSSSKVLARFHNSEEFFAGSLSDSFLGWGMHKDPYGFVYVGSSPHGIKGGEFSMYLPNGGHLKGYHDGEKEIHVGNYSSPWNQHFSTKYEMFEKNEKGKKIKGFRPVTNPLAPHLLAIQNPDGSLYNGESNGSIPHGYGYLKKKNGEEYWGWFEKGRLNGDTLYKDGENNLWQGYFRNGQKDGIFLKAGELFSYRENFVFDQKELQNTDQAFRKLEDWHQANREKDSGGFSDPPFEESYSFKVVPENIFQWDFQHNKGFKIPDPFFVGSGNKFNSFLQGDYHKKAVLLRHFGISGFNRLGALDSLKTDGLRETYRTYQMDRLVSETKDASFHKCELKNTNKWMKHKWGKNTVGGVSLYSPDCKNGKVENKTGFMVSGHKAWMVSNPKVKDKELLSGKIHSYDISRNIGFVGTLEKGLLTGFVRQFTVGTGKPTFFGVYQGGKRAGDGELVGAFKGKFSNDKEQGSSLVYDNGYFMRGRFNQGKKEGHFSFENFESSTTGHLSFKNNLRHGNFVEINSDGSLYQKMKFVNSRREGSGICRYQEAPEKCEFASGERIDPEFMKRKREGEVRAVRAQARLVQMRSERKKKEKQKEEMIARQASENRSREIFSRRLNKIKQNYRDQKNQKWWSDFQQNQRQNNALYNSFARIKPGLPGKIPDNSAGTGVKDGNGLSLKSSKGYERCELHQNFKGKKFSTYYNCNDNSTLPGAREELQRKITHYAKSVKTISDRKAQADRETRQMNESKDEKCRRHLSSGGNVCHRICLGTSMARNQNCSAYGM